MKKYIIAAISLVIFLISGSLIVKANPSYFATGKYLNDTTATTTPVSLGASASNSNSTSFIYDSYNDNSGKKVDSAVLLTQHIASTSASVLTTSLSFSMDGVDYFNDNTDNNVSTTTVYITIPRTFVLTGNTTASTTRTAITFSIPTRYVKVTLTGSVSTSSVWSYLVPVKQTN